MTTEQTPYQARTALTLLVAVAVALIAGTATLLIVTAPAPTPVVRAERGGLSLGTIALTGRVTLVASEPRLHWRIVPLTHWRHATGTVLRKDWDTRSVKDGAYRLELRRDDAVTTQRLTVRNSTPMLDAPLANDSLTLNKQQDDRRSVVAQFDRRSYRPGDVAVLALWGRYAPVRVEILHVGPETWPTVGNETMEGVGVRGPYTVSHPARSVRIPVGNWESGLYFVRLTSHGKTGFAPFIVRPSRLGTQRVAVVQPTNTWQAYNFRCIDGDGVGDTWYASARHTTVVTSRPYLKRGVPPHYRMYDVTFLHWLARTGKHVDMLAQEDLEQIPGDRLARLYRLIVFPGHHEYVTTREYDAVQRYRDLGGHLAFLSANNFFYRVDRDGNRLTRIGRWRDLGRPEAALVGVQYFAWNPAQLPSRPYLVVGARREPWLFAGTGVHNGSSFGMFGIEVDGRTSASPRGVEVLASMSNALGTHQPAEMTYYETARGARVFAAGGFTLASIQLHRRPSVARFLENLWSTLSDESESAAT